ncbi:MAG: hypothetical protein Q7U48_13900 [Hydrogenophaga sp.]|nr:hypothetical protein [Hydrogenophaga sp.]
MTRDQFLVLVTPVLPECPVPLIMVTAIEVIEDFVRRTSAWAQVIDSDVTFAGVSEYQLSAPAKASIMDLQAVSVGGAPVIPRPMLRIAKESSNWATATAARPSHYEFTGSGNLVLWPTPSESGLQIDVVARLVPVDSMTELPDAVMRTYRFAIADGVKSRLMLMPGVDWRNEALGVHHGERYEAAISEAASRTISGGSTAEHIIPPVKFG